MTTPTLHWLLAIVVSFSFFLSLELEGSASPLAAISSLFLFISTFFLARLSFRVASQQFPLQKTLASILGQARTVLVTLILVIISLGITGFPRPVFLLALVALFVVVILLKDDTILDEVFLLLGLGLHLNLSGFHIDA